jgi:demethylmenaquinone methyltransferase/2-methoxy-6-polyprenyl-1,4-benzoquinol methylase
MPFRERFDCLWCGTAWTTRGPDDLEGWAQLCPDCLGKAGTNEFLRARLRAALTERAGSGGPPATLAPEPAAGDPARTMVDYYEARAPEYDDWYLRRGRYARGPVHDTAWAAELDAAGRWLDTLPLGPRIVELAAGTGWWSTLLADKGELTMYDAAPATLDRARDRLLAHGLRAHLHVRDAWAEPEGDPADSLFAGFWVSHVERARLGSFLRLVAGWLRPGGRFAMIDSLPDPSSGAADHPPAVDDRSRRRLADGREFEIIKVFYAPDELRQALAVAGFQDVEVTTTGRFFVLATAVHG